MVDGQWFRTRQAAPGVTRIFEPHVHPLLRGNAWHVRGTARDLVVDAGLGVAPLRTHLPALFDRDPLLVVTHAHLDHAGGAHEFTDVAAHPAEAAAVERPPRTGLYAGELCAALGLTGAGADLPELLIDASPYDGFDPAAYEVRPAAVTRTVDDGDAVDLGGRTFTVVHLPGHSPGSVGLLDPAAGALFSGDALYDGALLDDLDGSDPAAYRATMRRLLSLELTVVYPGHGGPVAPERVRGIAAAYLRATGHPHHGKDPR